MPRQQYNKAPFRVCIVRYTCENCFRRWNSANGNLNDYQLCKNCLQKCYPGSHKWEEPNKLGNQNRETYISHNSELCGKCIRLGYSCMEIGDEVAQGTRVTNNDGEEIVLENNSDISSFIVKKIDKKKKSGKKLKSEAVTSKSTVQQNIIKSSFPLKNTLTKEEKEDHTPDYVQFVLMIIRAMRDEERKDNSENISVTPVTDTISGLLDNMQL